MKRLLLLSVVISQICGATVALSNSNGWKTRPVVPELARNNVSSRSKTQKWDAVRFLKQSSKFISLNPLKKNGNNLKKIISPNDVVWSATSGNENDFGFFPLDDVVMGGVSKSSFDNDGGIWSGFVDSANNGGFVGVRSSPSFQYDFSKCNGLKIKVEGGQGKRFKFIVRDSTDFNGVCWTSSFDVPKPLFGSRGTTSVQIPFSKQVPTIFARTVPDQKFNKMNVVGAQLAYSKFEYDGELNPNFELGEFELRVVEIVAY